MDTNPQLKNAEVHLQETQDAQASSTPSSVSHTQEPSIEPPPPPTRRRVNRGLLAASMLLTGLLVWLNCWLGGDSSIYSGSASSAPSALKLQLRLARAKALGDPDHIAWSLFDLGFYKWDNGEKDSAAILLKDAVEKSDLVNSGGASVERAKSHLYEYFESKGQWAEAAKFFEEQHPPDSGFMTLKSNVYENLQDYQRGALIYSKLGDKQKAALMAQGIRRSKLSMFPSVQSDKSYSPRLDFLMVQSGSSALARHNFQLARAHFSRLISNQAKDKRFSCCGAILMFVTSVEAGEYERAQQELPAAKQSFDWLDTHPATDIYEIRNTRGILTVFLWQQARLLREQGDSAGADAADTLAAEKQQQIEQTLWGKLAR